MSRVNRWISVTLAAVWFIAIAPSAALAQTVTRGRINAKSPGL